MSLNAPTAESARTLRKVRGHCAESARKLLIRAYQNFLQKKSQTMKKRYNYVLAIISI